MPIYARNDVLSVHISRGHGGCGEVHHRPAHADGSPVSRWTLTCSAGCEGVLRSDSSWSTTPSGVPETPDEEAVRLDVERRGQHDQAAATTTALTELSKLGDLPNALAQLAKLMTDQRGVAGIETTLPKPVMITCPAGHESLSSARFCADCGHPFKAPELTKTAPESFEYQQLEADSAPAPETADDPDDDGPAIPGKKHLETMSLAELRELARSLRLRTTRSKADQVAIINAARSAA